MKGVPPSADEVAPLLEEILWGRAASQVGVLPDRGALVLLPQFALHRPAIDVGRKAITRPVMHLRLVWDVPSVQVVSPGGAVTGRWSTSSLGHALAGETTVRPPRAYVFPTRRRGRQMVARLVRAGGQARGALLARFEPYVRVLVERANFAVSADLSRFAPDGAEERTHRENLLDDESVEQVLTSVLYGTDDRQGDVDRLIDRALDPHAFDRCDIDRHFRYNTWSRARSAVQRAVGDPHIGPKIRKLIGDGEQLTVAEAIDRYRALYPREHLSWDRATKALSSPLPQGRTLSCAGEDIDRVGGQL